MKAEDLDNAIELIESARKLMNDLPLDSLSDELRTRVVSAIVRTQNVALGLAAMQIALKNATGAGRNAEKRNTIH
jgi:hypothetical protein